jgi:WD40 repeat protein
MRAQGAGLAAYVWEVHTGRLRHRIRVHSGTVHALTFSPDGSLLATGAQDGSVCLWDLRERPSNHQTAAAY